MINKTFAVAMGAVLTLSACGGSNSSDEATFNQLAARGDALIEKYEDTDVTPAEAMPVAGTASYEGVAGYFFNSNNMLDAESTADADAVSKVSLQADFASSTISGSLDNFRDSAGEKIGGSVSITDGRISGNEFDASLGGEIVAEGEKAKVSGNAYGVFAGEKANAVGGVLDMDLIHSEDDIESVTGAFMAEKK